MAKLTLFQVVCIERGVSAQPAQPEIPDRLLVEVPQLILAQDAQSAAIQGVLELPPLLQYDRQRLEVLARPF